MLVACPLILYELFCSVFTQILEWLHTLSNYHTNNKWWCDEFVWLAKGTVKLNI
jgi:hypothetical protein